MDSVKYNNHNLIIRMLCLFMIVILCLFMIPSGSAQAVAGIDDAIFWSILNQTFMSAAGANYVFGSNGVAASEADPITEAILKDIYSKGELDRKFYDIVGQEISDFIDSIDWDNVFTVASGTSNIIANLPKVAVDTLTLFGKGIISELGATSDTSIDWNTDTGNVTSSYSIEGLEGFNYVNALTNTLTRTYITGNYIGTVKTEPSIASHSSIVYGGYAYRGNSITPYYISDKTFTVTGKSAPSLTDGGWYIKTDFNTNGIGSCSYVPDVLGNVSELENFLDTTSPNVDELTMTLIPESDTEAMVYPESVIEDYPNVESIPYYTDIPYTGTIPDTGVIPYTEAIPYLQEAVQSNTLTASLETTQNPSINVPDGSVTIPLFNITLPDFQFNFTGIWYYVVQWVNSLGAWLSQMFTIWGILPASMVYPVWATAVIVIVLGVYKRFFM